MIGLGAAVRRAGGVEVGQERSPPALQSAAEPGDLADRVGREPIDDLGRQPATVSGAVWWLDLPQLLSALPGDEHLNMTFIGVDRGRQPVRQAFLGAPQQVTDAVERVALAAPGAR
ncbi:MAG TPA: hypothetical protein VI094_16750 [Propionibacteriaceae bacterium]